MMARAINCNIRSERYLRQCYRDTGGTVEGLCSGKPRVTLKHVLELALVDKWSNISQQELSNLVPSPRMKCSVVLNAAGGRIRNSLQLLIQTPLCLRTHYSTSVYQMSVKLVQFMSQLLNIFMFIQMLTGFLRDFLKSSSM